MIPPLANPEAVLAQAPYVRGLARELVFDPDLARDIEQQTLLAALEHAPREPGRLRGWLAAIVRNFAVKAWRTSERRERREQACARSEAAVPSPAEILEGEDQRRQLVEHVLALDEPLRAVLILRFFQELPPREVARRLALPVETVRTRTRRGLELLRERLDRENRGSRAAWCLTLVRALQLPASTLQIGAALVSSSFLATAAALAVPALALAALVVGVARWNRTGDVDGGGERFVEPAGAAGSKGEAPSVSATQPVPLALVPKNSRQALATAQAASGTEKLTVTGSLLLRLAWHDGTPAADVGATLYSSANEDYYADALEVRTGGDGSCSIAALPTGSVSVFSRGVADRRTIVAGEEVELTLTIPLGFHVDGIVVDANGQPVAGAEILADESGQGWTADVVGHSGADGRFHVRSVADGLCWLSASASGFAPSARYNLMCGSGRTPGVQLTLPAPGGSLAGTVRGAGGQPIAHAQLLVGDEQAYGHVTVPEGVQAWRASARRVNADENGHFEVIGLAAGTQAVRVRARDFAPWTGGAEVTAGETAQLTVTLQAEASVEGTVTDASGAPVAGVEIHSGSGGFLDRVTSSGSDGSFLVRGLPACEFELRVEGERRGSVSTTLVGTPGVLLRWDPVLDGGLSLRARVVGAGVDPTACVVTCERWSENDVEYEGAARPDAQGLFEFKGLSDAGHRLAVLAADANDYPLAVVEDVHPGGGEGVIEVDAARWPSVRLKGRVLDALGDPLPGAALAPSPEGYSGSGPLLQTDATGSFDIGPYPPGRWSVLVQDDEAGELRTETVELVAGQTWDFGDLRMEP